MKWEALLWRTLCIRTYGDWVELGFAWKWESRNSILILDIYLLNINIHLSKGVYKPCTEYRVSKKTLARLSGRKRFSISISFRTHSPHLPNRSPYIFTSKILRTDSPLSILLLHFQEIIVGRRYHYRLFLLDNDGNWVAVVPLQLCSQFTVVGIFKRKIF